MPETAQRMNDDAAEAGASTIYLLLATIFRDIASAELIASLKAPDMLRGLEELECSFDDDFLAAEVNADLIENLAYDFTQLFIGPQDFISPYESIFHARTDDDWGKLWGADTVRVKKFIESAGIEFADDYGGIPDHIAVEPEFVGRMSKKIEEASAAGNNSDAIYFLKMKKLFYDEHLSQWLPPFCDKVIPKATTSFYREMARLLRSFVDLDHTAVVEDIATLANCEQ